MNEEDMPDYDVTEEKTPEEWESKPKKKPEVKKTCSCQLTARDLQCEVHGEQKINGMVQKKSVLVRHVSMIYVKHAQTQAVNAANL